MRKTVVVDLDGTLFSTNTFEHYILFVTKEALKQRDLWTVFYVAIQVALRKLRLISTHERMKYKILKQSARYANQERMRKLVGTLVKFENECVVKKMQEFKEKGYVLLLSTAAPKPYAEIISSDYGFDYFCATEIPEGKEWRENVNKQKKKNTIELINSFDGKLSVLITDHYDDIPLLCEPKECNYLVNPTEKTKIFLDKSKVIYSLL